MTLDYAFRMGQYTDAQERRRKAASKAEDRAYAIYHELGDIRSDVIVPADVNRLNQLCDALNDAVSEVTAAIYLDKMTKGRELSRDAAEAVGALEELVEAVKTLYGLNDDEDEEPADCVK